MISRRAGSDIMTPYDCDGLETNRADITGSVMIRMLKSVL